MPRPPEPSESSVNLKMKPKSTPKIERITKRLPQLTLKNIFQSINTLAVIQFRCVGKFDPQEATPARAASSTLAAMHRGPSKLWTLGLASRPSKPLGMQYLGGMSWGLSVVKLLCFLYELNGIKRKLGGLRPPKPPCYLGGLRPPDPPIWISLNVSTKWLLNDGQMKRKWYPNDIQMMPKWCPNDSQMKSKWYLNDVQMIDVQMKSKWFPK